MHQAHVPIDPRVTDYCLSTDLYVGLPEVEIAKKFLVENYCSRYGFPPHVTLSITPIPMYNLDSAIVDVDRYFARKSRIHITLGTLDYDQRSQFFFVPVTGIELHAWHRELTSILNEYRDGFVRSKDFSRLRGDYYSSDEAEHASSTVILGPMIYLCHTSLSAISQHLLLT